MTKITLSLKIEQEQAAHAPAIDRLLAAAFGPGRFAKTAERLREGNRPVADLCMVAFEGVAMRASVRFWPIRIGDTQALLLGPLAVDPAERGRGIGLDVMSQALDKAAALGHELVLLVGDLSYYEKIGFIRAGDGRVRLPGPVDPNRILVRPLKANAFHDVSGLVTRAFPRLIDS